jgi:hypothetical protein
MVSDEALKKLQEQIAAWPMTQRFVVQQLIRDYLRDREDLRAYKDTGLTPNDVTDMMAANGNAICEIVKLKEELQGVKNTVEQYAAINETLFDSNMKLGADRKALINELCQYCGKYKQAHEGACDGCRWREM